jgi:hypothetical protein
MLIQYIPSEHKENSLLEALSFILNDDNLKSFTLGINRDF